MDSMIVMKDFSDLDRLTNIDYDYLFLLRIDSHALSDSMREDGIVCHWSLAAAQGKVTETASKTARRRPT